MSENPAAPGPDDVEVPAWITDLVPIADLARSHLIGALPTAGVVMLASAVATRTITGTTGLARVLLLLLGAAGLLLAGRFTGRLARRPATARASADDGAPSAPVRPGGRTLAALLVLDIVGTALGLVVLGLAALREVDGGLAVAALVAGALIAVGTVGVLMDELLPQRGWAWLGCSGVAALLVLLGSGAVLGGGRGPWWLVVALVVLADAAGLLALRAGRRRDALA